MQKAEGKFFRDNVPMFGATPLAYAACFGFTRTFELLFVTNADPFNKGRPMLRRIQVRRRVINGDDVDPNPTGESSKSSKKLLPAVTLRLTGSKSDESSPQIVPADVSDSNSFGYFPIHATVACGTIEMFDMLVDHCGAEVFAVGGRCPRTRHLNLTPLQLAAWLGRKKMFKHILK